MFEFLTDPSSQFLIGVIITIFAIVISVVIYLKQRSRKKLSFEILSNTSVITEKEKIKNDIQLSYRGQIVEDVFTDFQLRQFTYYKC